LASKRVLREADLYYIEGLAMVGAISDAVLEECGGEGYRVVALERGGEALASKCLDKKAAERALLAIKLYARWGLEIAQPASRAEGRPGG